MITDLSEDGDDVPISEQKRVALAYLSQAWDEAVADGVNSDVLAHTALFAALSDLILSYGEAAVADLTVTLKDRILNREFTLDRTLQ